MVWCPKSQLSRDWRLPGRKFHDHFVDGKISSWISIESCFLVKITGWIIKNSHTVSLYDFILPYRVSIWLMLSRKIRRDMKIYFLLFIFLPGSLQSLLSCDLGHHTMMIVEHFLDFYTSYCLFSPVFVTFEDAKPPILVGNEFWLKPSIKFKNNLLQIEPDF